MPEYAYVDRDQSWLDFNFRVLEEAAGEDTPLLERIRFLSIYASNLDEFYRVRIPGLIDSGLLAPIAGRMTLQLEHFGQLLNTRVLPALAEHGIHFVYHEPIPAEAAAQAAHDYFFTQILAFLQPVYLSRTDLNFFPENDQLYFLLVADEGSPGEELIILNIPSDGLPRFSEVTVNDTRYILFIDDIIRLHLDFLFPGVALSEACSFKITRDAELDLADEYEGDIADKIERRLAKRDAGLATRLLYEPVISAHALDILIRKLNLRGASIVSGGRYHNLRDLADFPVKDHALFYSPWPAIDKDVVASRQNVAPRQLLQRIMEKDLLLHPPYESYDPVLRFFNEAAIHPDVEEIYCTMYRVARDSRIVHALISAARNGKKVTVFVELKARFDEANNLRWARKMKDAGVKIIYSIPFLKVHAKIALVKKKLDDRVHYAGLLATGNLNENTARIYTDHVLLTGQHDLMRELELLFIFLSTRKDPRKSEKIAFRHLLVAQFNLLERFLALIDREIQHAREGSPAAITIKMNNLEEKVLINKLYEASEAGVRIKLIVRGICCCVPGIPVMSSNISVKRIVDRYLEHGRVFIFHNKGAEDIFLGSSDWMDRNIYRRIEVCFPLYDESLRQQMKELIRLQLESADAAVADAAPLRPQEAIYNYLSSLRGIFYMLALFLLTALGACHSHESLPSPLWFYSWSSGTHAKLDSLLNTGNFVELRPDGSYTQDFGRFEYGAWTYKDGQLYLSNQKHTTYIYQVPSLTPRQMQLVFGKDRIGHFKGNPQSSGRDSKDPFSIQNNQWRIPATHKESIPEIRHRLFNHFEFWEAYFNWAVDNDIETIDVSRFPTPMKIYGNGFGLKRYDSLSLRWKSCFFDEEDCHKADTLIKGVFRRNNINWLEYDNRYQTFVSGFHQMKEHLR
jgi:polyphosphate kinase